MTVTNTNNSGPGSLRQAVIDADSTPAADEIVFDGSFSTPKTIQLTTHIDLEPVAINGGNLTITGPGADRLTIRAADGARILMEDTPNTISISGMTLTRGRGPGGNAIHSTGGGTFKATDVVMTDNVTTGTGGAVYSGGNLELLRCELAENGANQGAAIYLANGTAKITDCRIVRNTSTGGGGAIMNSGDAMEIISTTIEENTAGASGNADGGGAIYSSAELTLRNCVIRKNIAGGNTRGGALVNEGKMTLIETLVTQNSATGSYGGAIYHGGTTAEDSLTITDSTISHNEVNAARLNTGRGGGLYVEGANNTTITGSTFHENHVRMSATPEESTQSHGGAIWSNGGLKIDRSTISLNTAGRDFGGVRVPHNFHESTVTNSTIAFNTAGRAGGGFGKDHCNLGCLDVFLGNTIVANNTAPEQPDLKNTGNSHNKRITSLGYNLIRNTETAVFAAEPTDILGMDPLLGELLPNGGPTWTHVPQPSSPAIDKGRRITNSERDQIGNPRPLDAPVLANAEGGDGSDIGAVEIEPPANTPVGNNVAVIAPAGDASVRFANVRSGGFTSVAPNPFLPAPFPTGYTAVPNAPAYEITTTTQYQRPITVCFDASKVTNQAEFNRLRILHGEGGQLVDRTITRPDQAAHIICGRVDSFSPFVTALAPEDAPLPTPQIVSAVSRKMHGGTAFDIPLPVQGAPGIESRSGGASGNHQVVITFDSPVDVASFSVVSADDAAGATVTADGAVVTVNLTSVTNQQTLWVALAGVNNGTTAGDVYIPIAVLTGDVNGNGTVNATDIAITKSRSGLPVDAANFRSDVVANGSINATDIGLVKSRSGSTLPQ